MNDFQNGDMNIGTDNASTEKTIQTEGEELNSMKNETEALPTVSETPEATVINPEPPKDVIQTVKPNQQEAKDQKDIAEVETVNLLVSLALEHADFNHTPNEESFASIRVHRHIENIMVNTGKFKQWLTRIYYLETGDAPDASSMKKALSLIEAKALFDGKKIPLHIRYAEKAETIFVDLCNTEWEQVKISKDGWEIIGSKTSPVKFIRPQGMAELSKPVKGGSFDNFRKFLNIESDEDWVLTLAWIIGVMKESGPFPILCLQGEQGSSKSFTARLLRDLLDPSTVPLQSLPRSERDLVINAGKTWLLNFDNLSGMKNDQADAFCRIATGGGFRTRKLRTDTDEIMFCAVRPMIMNGIVDVASRNDLADRSLIVNLPVIPKEKRLAESEIRRSWETLKPGILGVLYDAVSSALTNHQNIKLPELPRMADFAIWVSAAEPSLPWEAAGTFMKHYENNRMRQVANSIDSDVVALAMIKLVIHQTSHEWQGTATELLKLLEHYNDFKDYNSWPKTPNALSGRLKRIAGSIREKGIEIVRGKAGNRFIQIFTNAAFQEQMTEGLIMVPVAPLQAPNLQE